MRGRNRSLVACVLLSGALGSIHAYSLFIEPFETKLDASRGAVSAVYSVALLMLTASVLLAHPLFRRCSARVIVLGVSLGVASGLSIAAVATSLPVLILGYGVLFGGFNGVGYALALQASAETNPGRRGFSMGTVTAAYALGAAAGAALLDRTISLFGASGALWWLAAVIFTAGVVAAMLLPAGVLMPPSAPTASNHMIERVLVVLMWAAYGLVVVAGLMALGHAAAVVDAADPSTRLAPIAVVAAGLANALGGVAVALTADRGGIRRWLVSLPIASAAGLAALAAAQSAVIATGALVVVALTYGAVIAAYPVAVGEILGDHNYPRVYGLVFTAWGLAGLVGPFGAGYIFDTTGRYTLALILAATRPTSTSRTTAPLAICTCRTLRRGPRPGSAPGSDLATSWISTGRCASSRFATPAAICSVSARTRRHRQASSGHPKI